MKVIMYHYVRSSSKDFPFFRYLSVENFCKQLDFFEKEFGFVKFEDFLKVKEDLSYFIKVKDKILLTFDDGLIDHFHFVLPELVKRGLFALFFVPTAIYEREKALDVHRIHYLLGRNGGGGLMSFVKNILDDDMLEQDKIELFKAKTYTKQDNDSLTTEFKKLFNYYIKYEYKEAILDKIVNEFSNDKEIFSSLYMSIDNLKSMHKQGMIIGSHSCNHLVFSKLKEKEQEKEIEDSFDFLESILKKLYIKTFCYPYGGFHTFTKFTEQTLQKQGVSFSFNVESRDVSLDDVKNRAQALPRYDCNEFCFGKANLG